MWFAPIMKSELADEFSFENSRHASLSMTLSACARRSLTSTKPTVSAGSSRSRRGLTAFVGCANCAAATPASTSAAAANMMKPLLFSLSTMNLRSERVRKLPHLLAREDVLRREVEPGGDEQHAEDGREFELAVEFEVDALALRVRVAHRAADDPVNEVAAEVDEHQDERDRARDDRDPPLLEP